MQRLDDGQRWILLEAQQQGFAGYLPEAKVCGARWSVFSVMPLVDDEAPWSRAAMLAQWRLSAGAYESSWIPHAWVGARSIGEADDARPRLRLDLALPDGWDGRLRAELGMHPAWGGAVPNVLYLWVGLRRRQPSGCGCGCGGASASTCGQRSPRGSASR